MESKEPESLKYSELSVGMKVIDEDGDVGIIKDCSDIHNVEVEYYNHGKGLFCLDHDCSRTDVQKIHLFKYIRKPGYYWVKTQNGEWHVACWESYFNIRSYWKVCWHKFAVDNDNEFLEIEEIPLTHIND